MGFKATRIPKDLETEIMIPTGFFIQNQCLKDKSKEEKEKLAARRL